MKIILAEKKAEILQTIEKIAFPKIIPDLDVQFDTYFAGFDGKASVEKVYSFISKILNENDLILGLDWKWSVQDELELLKTQVNNFNYELSSYEVDQDYKVTGKLVVNGKEYELASLSEYDFFELVNRILYDIDFDKRILIIEGGTGDTLFYCYVLKENYDDLLLNEFLPYVCG